jgi:hypothetical protein
VADGVGGKLGANVHYLCASIPMLNVSQYVGEFCSDAILLSAGRIQGSHAQP